MHRKFIPICILICAVLFVRAQSITVPNGSTGFFGKKDDPFVRDTVKIKKDDGDGKLSNKDMGPGEGPHMARVQIVDGKVIPVTPNAVDALQQQVGQQEKELQNALDSLYLLKKSNELNARLHEIREKNQELITNSGKVDDHCVCESPLDYCGYRIRYNPYTNCMKINGPRCCGDKAKDATTLDVCSSDLTKFKGFAVGKSAMLEVMGLNPLRYTYTLGATQTTTESDWSGILSTRLAI